MTCPRCSSVNTIVKKTITGPKNHRMRECVKCGYIWHTIEIPKVDKYLKGYTYDLLRDENWMGDNALEEERDV